MKLSLFGRGSSDGGDNGYDARPKMFRNLEGRNASPDGLLGVGGAVGSIIPTVSASLGLLGGGAAATTTSIADATTVN